MKKKIYLISFLFISLAINYSLDAQIFNTKKSKAQSDQKKSVKDNLCNVSNKFI